MRYIEALPLDSGAPRPRPILYRFWYDETAFPLRLKSGQLVPNEAAYLALLRGRRFQILSKRSFDGIVIP